MHNLTSFPILYNVKKCQIENDKKQVNWSIVTLEAGVNNF